MNKKTSRGLFKSFIVLNAHLYKLTHTHMRVCEEIIKNECQRTQQVYLAIANHTRISFLRLVVFSRSELYKVIRHTRWLIQKYNRKRNKTMNNTQYFVALPTWNSNLSPISILTKKNIYEKKRFFDTCTKIEE